jgi:hypothetical protein
MIAALLKNIKQQTIHKRPVVSNLAYTFHESGFRLEGDGCSHPLEQLETDDEVVQ